VIGVDKGQLASSAKALFGQDLVFEEYYRKFVHRDVSLQVSSQPMKEKFCRKLVEEYLSNEAFEKKKRFSHAKHDDYRADDIVDLCIAFSLNARQIHDFFRTTAHVFSTTVKSTSYLLWGWQIGTFFMTALSIKNRKLYDQIGSSEISLVEFTTFLKELHLFDNTKGYDFGWAALLYLGIFHEQPLENLKQEFEKLGIWDPTNKAKDDFQIELNNSSSAFGRSLRPHDPVFSKIYQTLEGLRTFAGK
jgi:hypothetical protein